MNDPYRPTHRIDDQYDAYRKGLVLGLTMAEVGILIIFVLLLLLVTTERKRYGLARNATSPTEVAALRKRSSTLVEAATTLGLSADAPPEDFVKLVRVAEEAVEQTEGRSDLVEARQQLNEIRQARDLIERTARAVGESGAASLADTLKGQAFRIANQEGQLASLQRKLASTGRGAGERSCWAKPNGSPDFLFDVVLASEGIRMRDHANPSREAERARLPLLSTRAAETMAEATFRSVALPYFRHGVANNCRFYVVIYDATGAQEKARYKNLLKTVEGYFYKRLDDGRAPF
jgi:hypothetical protein